MNEEENVCSLDEATDENITVTCIYNIILTNDLACARVASFLYHVKKSPQYKQQVKQEVKRLEKLTQIYERMLIEVAAVRAGFLSDVTQTSEEELDRDIELLRYSIEHEFLKSKCSNARLMSYVELAYIICQYACLSLDKRIQEMKARNIPDAERVSYLRITDIFKSVSRLSEMLFEGGCVRLNNSFSCKTGMRIIEKKLTDAHLIAKAINAADALNPAED